MTTGELIDQSIGFLAFALNVWGNLELTKVGNRGHIIRLVANAVWIAYSITCGAWALTANHIVFAGINVLGYTRWKRLEQEGKIVRHYGHESCGPRDEDRDGPAR